MIKIIEMPQRNDNMKIECVVDGDVLIVTINGITEEFDFTGLPEGMAESISSEYLPVNPIVSAEKVGNEVVISLIRFYDIEEKGMFENGENPMEV